MSEIRVFVGATRMNSVLILSNGKTDGWGNFSLALNALLRLTDNGDVRQLSVEADDLTGWYRDDVYLKLPVSNPIKLVVLKFSDNINNFTLYGASSGIAIELKKFAGTRVGLQRIKPPIKVGQSLIIEWDSTV